MRHGQRVGLAALGLLAVGAVAGHQAQRHVDPLRRADEAADAAYRVAPDPALLRAASLGQQTLLADGMWLRSVLAYTEVLDAPTQDGVRWVRQMFLSVHALDPGWRTVYFYGGSLLRSLDDIDGSDQIFLAGHEALPDDPYFPFSVAMNAYLYRDDVQTAHLWMDRAGAMPAAPRWYRAAAAGIVREAGDRDAAIRYLEGQLEVLEEAEARAPVEERLQSLRHEALSEQLTDSLRAFEASSGQQVTDLAPLQGRLPPDPYEGSWLRSPDGRVRSSVVDGEREAELRRKERKLMLRVRAP